MTKVLKWQYQQKTTWNPFLVHTFSNVHFMFIFRILQNMHHNLISWLLLINLWHIMTQSSNRFSRCCSNSCTSRQHWAEWNWMERQILISCQSLKRNLKLFPDCSLPELCSVCNCTDHPEDSSSKLWLAACSVCSNCLWTHSLTHWDWHCHCHWKIWT